MLVAGCGESQTFDMKKKLILSVNKFYDAILERDLQQIYEYFPDEFKQERSLDEFLAVAQKYSDEELMGAFALLPIESYEISSISKLDLNRYEVTVIIDPADKDVKMKDIMIWRRLGPDTWENESYKKLVSNLIESALDRGTESAQVMVESKVCKTRLQHLMLAVWEYTTRHNLSVDQFNSMSYDDWIKKLSEEEMFVENKIPACPTDGSYTISYDPETNEIVVDCSSHSAMKIPFKFGIKTQPAQNDGQ